jgi:hypothetical protein
MHVRLTKRRLFPSHLPPTRILLNLFVNFMHVLFGPRLVDPAAGAVPRSLCAGWLTSLLNFAFLIASLPLIISSRMHARSITRVSLSPGSVARPRSDILCILALASHACMHV